MSSRYPPPARERSPPRYDRRPSSTNFAASSQRDPPRGPKADFRGGGNFPFSSAPRGRGGAFAPRPNDSRDRDWDRERDIRLAPQSYRGRDDDRAEWPRRDREFPPADRPVAPARDNRPYVGRERSASPIRSRRDSRESLPSTFSRVPDAASSYYAPAGRGGLSRGRGRGDWDRGRGRSSYAGERERDLFHPRSRSRESWRDRDFDRGRPLPGDADRSGGYDRRDYDRSREREVRGRDPREHDLWQREPSPARVAPLSAGSSAVAPAAGATDRPGKLDLDAGRRPSVVPTQTGAVRDGRRDVEASDYFGASRLDTSRRDPPQSLQQPPAAVGLDYGPPPSLPPVTTPAAEKSAPIKQQPPKPELATPSSTTFMPPSGPKAGRAVNATNLGQAGKPSLHQDSWGRSEPASRPTRPSLAPTTSLQSSDINPKKEEPFPEPKPSAPQAVERSLPPNIPSGPRLGNAPPYKQRLSSIEPIGSAPPPSAPREITSKPFGVDSRAPVIPTGPRLDREAPRPPLNTAPKAWISPNDRPGFIPTGPRQQNAFPTQSQKPRTLHAFGSPVLSAPSGPKALIATSPRLQEAKMTLLPPRKPVEDIQASRDVDMSASASSADEDEAEDDSFDEEYFAESEATHKREMKLLEARKPPPLLEDPTIVALLVKLQFLEMILRETAPRPVKLENEVGKEEIATAIAVQTELPSPGEVLRATTPEPEQQLPDVWRRPLKETPINPIPTPPIESLPYLKSGPPERVVFEESDNEVEHEAVAILLQQEFEREAWDLRADLEEKHAEFKLKYSLWKQEINQIEQERREQQASPAPASPAPSAAPSVTPSLTHERTRGARNTTEADLEVALLLSKQSAKEEEERREREAAATSLPNYDTEAAIPPMLTATEIELSQFEDTNNLIPHGLVKHKYAYWPPVDDFTAEEQELFITAYCQNPKKWSKIAESIPGRTYQDCITHYYLTKDQTRYKEIFKRSQPKRRGRGKAATKPRSTALLSELQRGDDTDGTPLAVTDSGRPRRAAAPTFGDAPSEADPSTPVPQSKKLTAALSNPDATASKTSRGRKTGTGAKARKTKAQIQAEQQQTTVLGTAEASPGKVATATKAERGRTVLRAGDGVPMRADGPPAPQPQRIVEAALPQYPVSEMPLVPALAQTATTSAVTSYWSVPEQHKFPELLAYFGRDFAAIADFMKTKSVTMIKNYYSRQINDGKDEFEKIAQVGDQRRMAGEVIPQPPSPIAPAKRRYDTTPSLTPASRPPMQPDLMNVDGDPVLPVMKSNIVDEFPQSILERNPTGDIVSKPRSVIRETPRETPLPGPLSTKTEELPRSSNDRIPVFGQKPHGPKAGFFQDDIGLQNTRPNFRPHLQESSPQILPQRPPELPRSDMNQQPLIPPLAQSLLGPREPMIQTAQRTQPPPAPLIQALHSQADKYPQPGVLHPGHSRNNSLANPNHSPLEPAQELSSLRRLEGQRPMFGSAMTGSPAPSTTPMPSSQPPRNEIPKTSVAPPPQDPPKPPVKRSNVFGLLNDDPPAPPPKRPSLETPKRTSILSPQIAPLSSAQNPLQQPRSQLHPDDPLLNRTIRGPYGHGSLLSASGVQQTSAEFPSAFSTPPVTAPSNETWMDRFDPRTQGAPAEQRNHRHSPAPSPYSVVPPGSQPPSLHGMRADTPRSLDRLGMDHRRGLLGQVNQMPHVPSPPPQQPTQPVPPLRSASSSSQHARVSSLGYPSSQQTSQSSSLGNPPAPQGHAQSAGSTPVSGLHHRPQSSLDFPPRLTIQQHMAQQTQQKQQEQQREHERHLQRQREMDAVVQRERERERDHQQHMRREIYGIDPLGSQVSRHNQLGATANQSHMSFTQREIPRTFTPPHPHSHGHTHSHSHSQYAGHGPVGPGGTPGLQHPLQHGLPHQQQPGGPSLHPSLHHPHHAQLHPGGHPGHFRNQSQGDARRDGRG
ncbi:hypothetical protein G647_00951 [Cladophialophora carrionii CBS 160.54]|uniref:SANT domain-containing protein n=1 Tax=Cladophialophora carrionii CBS 160.54 TaxID=1279043 RepID=V9DRC7_9EURO|nr:uncharacterized protein G647_00951 [Cladophialophora carrionii CBS 160.54]ETI28502.1 hypothetical protein G647_00951 [Cladophialophora carrionii CBS 160.54]